MSKLLKFRSVEVIFLTVKLACSRSSTIGDRGDKELGPNWRVCSERLRAHFNIRTAIERREN